MRQALAYALCYLMWAVSAALGVLAMIFSRGLLVSVFALTPANRWILSAVDKFGLILLGLAWLVFVIAVESYYRNGVDGGDLARRFGLVTAVELSVTALAYVLPLLIL
jgi:hypothetical protein